ncbi:MAG: pyrimidine/purine nucleoside phosphorylase [Polyangiales bacterium]
MDNDAKKTALQMIPYGLYVLTAEDAEGKVAAATVNRARFDAGSSFVVGANQKFQLQVAVDTAYLCTYE